jgi:AraC-like DNA-binding protein
MAVRRYDGRQMAEIEVQWLARTEAAVARLYGDLDAVDPADVLPLLEHFVDGIDAPPDRPHNAALSLILINVCVRVVAVVHDRETWPGCRCHTISWSGVGELTKWNVGDARLAFRKWATAFLEQVQREHPASPGVRAAALIRADPLKAWTLKALAQCVGTRPVRLRHDFHRRFDMRVSAYLHLVRAARALPLFRTAVKVEAVAWEVGYRSKKDLYAALRRWVGSTPGELRALTDEELRWLQSQLRTQYVGAARGFQPRDCRVRRRARSNR